jgi:hypothetical protein
LQLDVLRAELNRAEMMLRSKRKTGSYKDSADNAQNASPPNA